MFLDDLKINSDYFFFPLSLNNNLSFDYPGVGIENLEVKVENSMLQIFNKKDKTIQKFTLPQNVDIDKISASYIDGVLKINFNQESAPTSRQIEISTA